MMSLIEQFLLERHRDRHHFMIRGKKVRKNVNRKKGYRLVSGHHKKMSSAEIAHRRAAAKRNAIKRKVRQHEISRRAASTYRSKSKRNVR